MRCCWRWGSAYEWRWTAATSNSVTDYDSAIACRDYRRILPKPKRSQSVWHATLIPLLGPLAPSQIEKGPDLQ